MGRVLPSLSINQSRGVCLRATWPSLSVLPGNCYSLFSTSTVKRRRQWKHIFAISYICFNSSHFPISHHTFYCFQYRDFTETQFGTLNGFNTLYILSCSACFISRPDSTQSRMSPHPIEAGQGRKPWPGYFIVRNTGEVVPLIAIDELPHGIDLVGIPRALDLEDTVGMLNLGLKKGSGACYQVSVEQSKSGGVAQPK